MYDFYVCTILFLCQMEYKFNIYYVIYCSDVSRYSSSVVLQQVIFYLVGSFNLVALPSQCFNLHQGEGVGGKSTRYHRRFFPIQKLHQLCPGNPQHFYETLITNMNSTFQNAYWAGIEIDMNFGSHVYLSKKIRTRKILTVTLQ